MQTLAPATRSHSGYALIVDTSVHGVGMAVLDPSGRCCWQEIGAASRATAATLSRFWEAAHAQTPALRTDLHQVVISPGPGSFTGIKSGLAWAYGLAAGSPQPLQWLAVSGLVAAAASLQRAAPDVGETLVLSPSTRTHAYLGSAAGAAACSKARPQGQLVQLQDFGAGGAYAERAANGRLYLSHGLAAWTTGLAEAAVPYTELAPGAYLNASLAGLVVAAATATTAAWQTSLPLPNYQRLSTAEERAAAG